MRKAMLPALCALAVFGSAMAADTDYRRFDGMLPGSDPQLFAPNMFRADKSYIGYQALRGDELIYATTDAKWTSSALYLRKADRLFEAKPLDLLHSSWEGEPFVSADGKRLYFTAILPPGDKPWHSDLYVAMRQGEGWGTPKPLPAPVNTAASEWHVSLTAKGVFYFCSERDGGRLKGDIFRAVPEGASYRVDKLPDTVNTAFNDCDPLIAPDESWLIFHSDRPGGFGAHDLYISFRDVKGGWSPAVNMGPSIHTAAWEMAPSLTPDGKFLMFVRRKAFETTEPSRIWWVSSEIIARYRGKK
jgi:hypothetical protein